MFRQLPVIAVTAALGLLGATGVASAQATGTENNATSGSMKGSGSEMKGSGSDMKGSSSGSMEMKDKSSSDMKPTGQMKDDQMKSTPNSSMQK